MNLIEYLIKNENRKESTDVMHDKLLNDIETSPHKINLHNISSFYREVNFPNGNNHGRVDLIAISEDQLYIIEAKVIRTNDPTRISKTKNALNEQLRRAYRAFRNEFQTAGQRIGVYKVPGSSRLKHYRKNIPFRDLNKTFIRQ